MSSSVTFPTASVSLAPTPPPQRWPLSSRASDCFAVSSATANLVQKVGAEAVSTFILVFSGCGALMVDAKTDGGVSVFGICAAFGLVVMVMIYSVGHISGAHMNPAVTLAFASVRHFPWKHVPAYLAAQILASIVASFSLRLILGPVGHNGATLPRHNEYGRSFVLEILITAILMFVICAVSMDTRAIGELAGLAVGSTVGLNVIFAGPISGASMNPARSIGPALANKSLKSLWLYILGPILGAVLGAWAYNCIRMVEKPEPERTSKPSNSFSFGNCCLY